MEHERSHLTALTGLRFLAAIHVVLFHRREAFPGLPYAVENLLVSGNIGVNLFFVLSGFVLAYNYMNDDGLPSRREFWVARFARIYPVYLLAFLLFAPVVAAAALAAFGSVLGGGSLNRSPLFAFAYCLVLIGVSVATLYWYEMPARRAVKQFFGRRRPLVVEATAS